MSINGIDISSNNPGYKSLNTAGLDFCVVKLTQGAGYVNPLAAAQLAWARTWAKHVGIYHWVEPWIPAANQANHFIDTAHLDGPFDFWALDCEDNSHQTGPTQWVSCVNTILQLCKAHLGLECGSVYVGQFFCGGALVPLAKANNWWLPDYGHNDGAIHPTSNNAAPVIHQYSSAGRLDRNVVTDEPAFYRMVGKPAPIPSPVPQAILESGMFLVQEKGSQTVHAIGAGPNGVTDIEAAHLNGWKGALIGSTGHAEAGNIWPVEPGFCDNIRKGS